LAVVEQELQQLQVLAAKVLTVLSTQSVQQAVAVVVLVMDQEQATQQPVVQAVVVGQSMELTMVFQELQEIKAVIHQ
jgi:hypothetical protein